MKVTQSCLTLWGQNLYSRPEYWRGWPFPSPGELPNPGIEPRSPALQVDSLPIELSGKQGIYEMSAFTMILNNSLQLENQVHKNMRLFPSPKHLTLPAAAVTTHMILRSSMQYPKEPAPTSPGGLHPQQRCTATIREHYDAPIFLYGKHTFSTNFTHGKHCVFAYAFIHSLNFQTYIIISILQFQGTEFQRHK